MKSGRGRDKTTDQPTASFTPQESSQSQKILSSTSMLPINLIMIGEAPFESLKKMVKGSKLHTTLDIDPLSGARRTTILVEEVSCKCLVKRDINFLPHSVLFLLRLAK